ncbi:MAG: peptide chain release factor N(5)-glutamine methyltransferase [Clostridia bacterium]|nr:peptide chain release factor N(5)-glutamine methyltransferase [Clostridia bacterium]MEE1184525.1 peptide chain release factor N(5)-glutamine methyltransferase [Acutalibacteraceae bacterium]
MTIFEAYNKTKKELAAAGIEDYVFEAKQILRHITGFSNVQIISNPHKKLSLFEENNLTAIIKQRLIRYPLQYIIGEWGFYGGNFKVGPGVLVPRADTETLIDIALEFLKDRENSQVCDLCTGSGCIGITVAREKSDSFVTAVEKYEEALRYARENAKLNGTENIEFISGDVFEGAGAEKQYDLILSNPPYIPPEEMKEISPEAKFEPETALLGGEDGLDFYRAIIKGYKASLVDGGMMAFEVGMGEAEAVAELMKNQGFCDIGTRQDAAGIERVVFGTVKTV